MWNELSIEFLRNKDYLKNGQSLESRLSDIYSVIKSYEDDFNQPGLSERCKVWIDNQYISLSTPQLSNVGKKSEPGKKTTDLPCSCNILSVPNSIAGIYYSLGEAAMLSKLGAGVGINYLNVFDGSTQLQEGFKSNSKLDWVEDSIKAGQKVSQGSTRRGYVVPFDSIMSDHFDKESGYKSEKRRDFYFDRLSKNNPDKNDPFINNNMGFSLPVGFRQSVRDGDKEAQRRLLKVLQLRKNIGRNYIVDVENMNKNISPVYQKLKHKVDSTNICTEAITASYDDKTFACMLLSLNLVHWDFIKANPQIIKDAFVLLDIMVQLYIDLTEGVPFLEKARRSAIEKRDIGLGTLGFHEYLQSKMYAFGDLQSRIVNREIYETIRVIGEEVTKELGEQLGSPKLCQEAGMVRRNVSLMMIAPNKSTGFIMNQTSEGINPFVSNYTLYSLAGIEAVIKNKNLLLLLESYGMNSNEVWDSILDNLGSVQHLEFLTKHEKDVFKTASEISPKDMIDLAADRQKYIDMGQSLNLWNRPNYTLKDIYDIHMYAFDKDIKTLYYFFPQAHAALEKEGEDWDTCAMCAD